LAECLSSCLVDFGYSSTCFCRYWLSVGAQHTDIVRGILVRAGLISPPPMVVMGQKKGPAGETSNPEKSVKVTISAAFMFLLFCTCMLDPALNGSRAKFPFQVVE
jgi:hypothetical protein